MPFLECVPNISEGRRPEVISRLAEAVRWGGATVLDVSSDPDHNRSVFTLAGEADVLHGSLLALYEIAVAEIDLRSHHGVHPRVGAVDVAPFIPLEGATMADAVAAARRLGAAVGERFGVPVYLYEEAQERPERRALPVIRRGGFEGFAAKISDPAWAPDFGPSAVHPTAGVTVIGARFFLIAFNAVLTTGDVEIAKAIAREVRASSGGLPAVRALGLRLESRGLAQVSLNLLDYRQTSVWTAVSRIEEGARARGTAVLETELIGLIPEEAALGVVREALKLPGFGGGRLLEKRLSDSG